jgi:hypothetical protein
MAGNTKVERARRAELAAQGLKVCCKPECKQQNPQSLEAFHKHTGSKDGYASLCKDCRNTYSREWDAANPGRTLANDRRSHLKRYGLTLEVYDVAVKRAGGVCEMPGCGATEPGRRGEWHIDHDHDCCPGRKSCGKCLRGLLCNSCNTGYVPGLERCQPDHPYLTFDWQTRWDENWRSAENTSREAVNAV